MTERNAKPKVRIIGNEPFSPLHDSQAGRQKMLAGGLMAEIVMVIERIMTVQGMTRRALARKLGRSESTISRQLDGEANLTVDRIAEIFEAIDDRPYFSSAGLDCMIDARRVADLRPSFDAASAPQWLIDAGIHCDGTGHWQSMAFTQPVSAATVFYAPADITVTKKSDYAAIESL